MHRFQKPPESLVEIMQSVIGNSTQLAIQFYLGISAIPFSVKKQPQFQVYTRKDLIMMSWITSFHRVELHHFKKPFIALFTPTCFSSSNKWVLRLFVNLTYFLFGKQIWSGTYQRKYLWNILYELWRTPTLRPRTLLIYIHIYIDDISDIIQSSISLFADDTTLHFSSKFPSHLHQVLSEDLLTLAKWSDTLGVSFTAQNTKVLTVSSNRGVGYTFLWFSKTCSFKRLIATSI